MNTVIFIIAALAAGLVMVSGVWVAVVLMAVVARTKRSTGSAAERACS